MLSRVDSIVTHINRYGGDVPFPTSWPLSEKSLSEESDERLLFLMQNGSRYESEQAMAAVYNKYFRRIWNTTRGNVANRDDAIDVFLEVWSVFFEKIDEYQWEGIAFDRYLTSTAYRLRKKHYRVYSERGETSADEDDIMNYIESIMSDSPVSNVDADTPDAVRDFANTLVQKVLKSLKPKDRKIISLFYYKEWNNKQVADALGMSVGAVKTKRSRLFSKLRDLLESDLRNGGYLK